MPARNVLARYRFDPLDRLRFDNLEYVYVSACDAGHIMRQRNGNIDETFSHSAMADIVAKKSFDYQRRYFAPGPTVARERSGVSSLSDIPDEELPEILWKFEICKLFLTLEHDGKASRSDASMTAALSEIGPQVSKFDFAKILSGTNDNTRKLRSGTIIQTREMPSPRSLRNWLSKLSTGGFQPYALRNNYRQSGDRHRRLEDPLYELMEKHTRDIATEKRQPKLRCYEALETEIEVINAERVANGEVPLKVPSLTTFLKQFDKLDAFFVASGQYGVDNAKNFFRLVTGAPDVTRPGQRVEMDAWKISLQVVLKGSEFWKNLTPEERETFADADRWWICVAIDYATKCIIGMWMSPSENGATAKQTLRMIVSDKSRYACAVGSPSPWPMTLVPEEIYTDGGSAFVSNEFRQAVLDLGAAYFIGPVGIPAFRATIERFFSTMKTRLTSNFTGQAFSGVAEKGDYDAQGRASVTLANFADAAVLWITAAYHNHPHGGLSGELPKDAWQRLTAMFPLLPPPGADTLRAIFGTTLSRKTSNRGVIILGLPYLSQSLGARFLARAEETVSVRVDPQNLGAVSVKFNNEWHRVPCLDREMEGVSMDLWIETQEDIRRRHAENARIERSTYLATMEAIRTSAGFAERASGIEVSPVTSAKIEHAERELFAGFVFNLPDDSSSEPDVPIASNDFFRSAIPTGKPDNHSTPSGRNEITEGKRHRRGRLEDE